MTEINDNNNCFTHAIYHGREEDIYTRLVRDTPIEEIIPTVQTRIEIDGQWCIDNDRVGDNEDKMRRMMAWASNETNIRQCVNWILDREPAADRTVDFVCRDLCNASKGAVR